MCKYLHLRIRVGGWGVMQGMQRKFNLLFFLLGKPWSYTVLLLLLLLLLLLFNFF